MITIGGIIVDSYIQPPVITYRNRARSVVYALDGTAKEDRLGGSKKLLTLPFALLPAAVWEELREKLLDTEITVSGSAGGVNTAGTYRLSGNDIPTPIMYVDGLSYICKPFDVILEEI